MNDTTGPIFDQHRFYHPASARVRAPVAVSACLAGAAVRYDGAARLLPALTRWLEPALLLVPVCPEAGAGLGVPRPPVQLVDAGPGAPARALGRDDPTLDVSAALRAYAATSEQQLRSEHTLCGYLFKSRSPSCGVNSTPLFAPDGSALGYTSGIQAAHFQARLPWLVFCEEGELTEREAAWRFVLQCRLVFDLVHAGAATPLALLHRHYGFLVGNLPAARRTALGMLAEQEQRPHYLAQLHAACGEMTAAGLLDLFE